MSVLVDTPIWSSLFRRNHPTGIDVHRLRDLITQGQAELIGSIRQEILSGIRLPAQFDRVRQAIQPFPDFPISGHEYELAAEFYNTCRSAGVQGSNTDFLICAVASRNRMQIFTTDQDFTNFARHLPIDLMT